MDKIEEGKKKMKERIMLYKGKKKKIGEKKDGEQKMEWMEKEKERGIKIKYDDKKKLWKGSDGKKRRLKIIEKNGKVELKIEVESQMSVIEGEIEMIEENDGVEKKKEKVWSKDEK